MSEHAYRDENVPNEAEVDAAIDDQLARTSAEAAIPFVSATPISDAASPGSSYVQAEVVALRTEIVALNARQAAIVTALNNVIEVLEDAQLVPANA